MCLFGVSMANYPSILANVTGKRYSPCLPPFLILWTHVPGFKLNHKPRGPQVRIKRLDFFEVVDEFQWLGQLKYSLCLHFYQDEFLKSINPCSRWVRFQECILYKQRLQKHLHKEKDVPHGLSLYTPISTYKFSILISIRFLERLVKRICSKIKALSIR